MNHVLPPKPAPPSVGGSEKHQPRGSVTPDTPSATTTPIVTGGGGHHPSTLPPQQQHNWQDMTRTIAHYQRLEQIGLGTYGQVYRAICLDTGRTVAMKKMRSLANLRSSSSSSSARDMGMPQQLIREIKILKQLQHPNLLQMIEVVTSKGYEHLDPDDPIPQDDRKKKDKKDPNNSNNNEETDPSLVAREKYKGNLFLVLEYVTHDLTGLLDVAYQFTHVQVKCLFSQLLQALRFMHENKYVHRDIKSSNILVDSHYRLKLADFGLARSLEPPLLDQMEANNNNNHGSSSSGSSRETSQQDLTNKVITLWYRPPEVLLGTVHYGCAVDIWSAGCIFVELLCGKPLAAGKTELDQLTLVADLTGTPDAETFAYLFSLKKSRTLHADIPPTATEWREGERKPSKLRDRYGPNAKKEANKHIPEAALNLMEKLLEWDPRKRLTAAFALQNRYFWTQPVAPENPADLGRINVAADGHFHEFQTKQRRKQAKVVAEEARDKAILDGASQSEATKVFDGVYVGLMKKVAQEGFATDPVKKSDDNEKKVDLQKNCETKKSKGDSQEEKPSRNRETRVSEKEQGHRKDHSSSIVNKDVAPHDDHEDNKQDHSRSRRRHHAGTNSDEERKPRSDPKKRRDRESEKDDETSFSGDKRERRHKEKRRKTDDERKDRREKERRHRKDSTAEEPETKEVDQRSSPKVDDGDAASKELRSSKRSRRGSGGSDGKKERHSRRGSDRERRHREKHRSRSERSWSHERESDQRERPLRHDIYLNPEQGDHGRKNRGDDAMNHYGPNTTGFDPRDGPGSRGPRRFDEGRGHWDERSNRHDNTMPFRGPPRRDRDAHPLNDVGPGSSSRDRDGPKIPLARPEFGPDHGRDYSGPPSRGDHYRPARLPIREDLPPPRDFPPGLRRDMDRPQQPREQNASSRRQDGNGGPTRHSERDGPLQQERDMMGGPRRADRDYPRDATHTRRDGPMRGSMGDGGGPRRDFPSSNNGPPPDHRHAMPRPGDFAGGPQQPQQQRHGQFHRRPGGESRRDRR